MIPAHLDEQLPPELLGVTRKVLFTMGRLAKPSMKAGQEERERLMNQVSRVENAWKRLAALARKLLSNGNRCGVSFFQWQGSIWRDPSYKNFDAISGYWRQQTPDYREYKRRYDARRRRLRRLGVWEQAGARRRLDDAYERLVEAHASPETVNQDDRVRLIHSLVAALEAVERLGAYCPTCESTSCEHPPISTEIAVWVDRARRAGHERLVERPRATFGCVGVDEPPFEPDDGWDEPLRESEDDYEPEPDDDEPEQDDDEDYDY